jgi:hypothetical protein
LGRNHFAAAFNWPLKEFGYLADEACAADKTCWGGELSQGWLGSFYLRKLSHDDNALHQRLDR